MRVRQIVNHESRKETIVEEFEFNAERKMPAVLTFEQTLAQDEIQGASSRRF